MEKTLRQIIDEQEAQGVKIPVGEFGTMSDFLSYYDRFYVSILKELQEKWQGDKRRAAYRFFANDILAAFGTDPYDIEKKTNQS